MTTTYEEFVADKVNFEAFYGHDITDADVHPILKPHQRAIVRWAVKGGRRAIFAAFGIGKSVMQIETLRLTLAAVEPGARALIVCPLGVRIEFAHDATMLGVQAKFVRRTEEVDGPGLYITNYESVRDGKLAELPPVHLPPTRTAAVTAARAPEKADRPPGPRLYGDCEECGAFVSGERRLCGMCMATRSSGGRR